MKTATKTTAVIIAGLLATATFSGAAFADTTAEKKPVAETTETAKAATDEEVIVLETIEVSGHAKSVLTNVHNARLALFEGQTQAALQLVQKAHNAFHDDLEKYSIKLDDDKGYGVPLDYSIEMTEDFKPTQDNAAAIAKAGNLAKKGDTPAAAKVMASAGIDLSVKYAMLPAQKTMVKLDKVMASLKGENFYEANLTLKSIETSLLVEDFELSATPEQGHALDSIL